MTLAMVVVTNVLFFVSGVSKKTKLSSLMPKGECWLQKKTKAYDLNLHDTCLVNPSWTVPDFRKVPA